MKSIRRTNILITGVAGFIGYHVARVLLDQGHSIVGIDSLNRFYSPRLKADRLDLLRAYRQFDFVRINIANRRRLSAIFERQPLDIVLHLAAQAGVRHSVQHPVVYGQSNLLGFLNILEACRHHAPRAHLMYASSSSVYGTDTLPFVETATCVHPLSLYGATKRSNELMAHAYAHLYGLSVTGLRFFTVYGPYGRPDMAIFRFTQAMLKDRPLVVYNRGDMYRSFTYIDDVVRAVVGLMSRLLNKTAQPNNSITNPEDSPEDSSVGPVGYRLINIGGTQQHSVRECIDYIEQALRKRQLLTRVRRRFLPAPAGDVPATHANTQQLEQLLGATTWVPLSQGIDNFVHWYCRYYEM